MSIQAAIYLINSSSFAGSDSFYSVLIRYNLQSHKQLQEFLTQYMWRGYDLEAIEIDGRDRMNKETNFIDFISLSNPYINNKWCLKCNVLSIQSTDLWNIEKEENLLFSLKFLYFKILRINFSSIQKIKEVENLNCKTDKFDLDTPINSDSWYKLKLTDSICEIMKDIDSNLINPVAWLWRYFPKLKSVEFAIGNIIPQKILNAILPQEIQERHDLNQITNIEFNGCDIMKFFWKVSIDLQNVSFGVWLNDRVTMFHADRLLVDSLHSNWILIENPFKENNWNYLLIKNRISNIKIEGVKLDTKWSKPMYNQYSLLLNENLIEDDNEILLFIIWINEKKIPKYFDVHGFIVETIIDNYRQKYYLTWPAYSPLLNKIEQIFSGIECNSLIHLNIDKSDLTFNTPIL